MDTENPIENVGLDIPPRLEEEFPALAKHMEMVAQGNHPVIKSMNASVHGTVVLTRSGQALLIGKLGRNDPCRCGSGKKYKKCCLLKPRA